MKELSIEQMEIYTGGSEFLDGVACGYGLATITTGVGAFLALYGCGSVLGWW